MGEGALQFSHKDVGAELSSPDDLKCKGDAYLGGSAHECQLWDSRSLQGKASPNSLQTKDSVTPPTASCALCYATAAVRLGQQALCPHRGPRQCLNLLTSGADFGELRQQMGSNKLKGEGRLGARSRDGA